VVEDVDPGVDDADHHARAAESRRERPGLLGTDLRPALVQGRPGHMTAPDRDDVVEFGDPLEITDRDRADHDRRRLELDPQPGPLDGGQITDDVHEHLDPRGELEALSLSRGRDVPQRVHTGGERTIEFAACHPAPPRF
jgi:hypothetical protein